MTSDFNLARGVSVPDLSGIAEGYEVVRRDADPVVRISANISAERIGRSFRKLASAVPTPGFFIIEIPTHRDVEAELRKEQTDPFHVDVYFKDGISWPDGDALFSRFEDTFVNDGMISFGFGSHVGGQEVFVGHYKIFRVFCSDPQRFEPSLSELGVPRVERLRTVYDHFTRDRPGSRSVLDGPGLSIYDMVDALTREGFYLHGRRPG